MAHFIFQPAKGTKHKGEVPAAGRSLVLLFDVVAAASRRCCSCHCWLPFALLPFPLSGAFFYVIVVS